MAISVFCVWAVLAIGIGIWLAAGRKKREAQEGFDPETGHGVWVTKVGPMIAVFYIFSCIGTMLWSVTLPVVLEERSVSGLTLSLAIVGLLLVVLPLWWLVSKWRERTVIDDEGIQFPRLLGGPVRLAWDDVTELKVTVHKVLTRRGVRRFPVTEVSVYTTDKVYKPTWDKATWIKNKKRIIAAIVERARLVEQEPGHWVYK
jgi:hypothetical protein